TGSIAGTIVVQHADPSFLKKFIPILLLLVAGYVCLKPRLGEVDLHPRMRRGWFDALFGLGLGFYDGFLGPGTGTFWTMAFVLVMGFNLTKATGCTKIVNFASNISSLCLFLARGNVAIDAGLAMGLGQLLGARAGSRMVLRRGTKLIRPVFITVVFALLLKLLYEAFFRSAKS